MRIVVEHLPYASAAAARLIKSPIGVFIFREKPLCNLCFNFVSSLTILPLPLADNLALVSALITTDFLANDIFFRVSSLTILPLCTAPIFFLFPQYVLSLFYF